jgi:hypothetical protein
LLSQGAALRVPAGIDLPELQLLAVMDVLADLGEIADRA